MQAIKEAFQANDIDPTDPQIVYEHEVSHNRVADPETAERKARKRDKGFDAKCDPPQRVSSAADDPESELPVEDREGTLL